MLDVDGNKFLTTETFKTIFEKLDLGKIEKTDEDIFNEVTNAVNGQISLESFKKILQYNEAQEDEFGRKQIAMHEHMDMDGDYGDEM